jgi:endogenous inhibitor of DNA gyrase (YacG/DUF329 family)
MIRRCSICQRVIKPADEKESRKGKFYPFCSGRCKFVDLGRWLDGEYRIETNPEEDDQETKRMDNPDIKTDNNK